jgi:cytoskeleton protein RodZ
MDIGAELRAAREAKGMSLGTLAQRTRVQPRMLAAIEGNDVAAIPPRPFGRGFVRAFAIEVGLDPDRTVQNYFAQFPPTPPPPPPPRSRWPIAPAFDPPSQWTGLGSAMAILLLVVAAAIAIGRDKTSEDGTSAAGRDTRDAIGTAGRSPRATATPAVIPSAPPASAGAAAAPTPPMRLAFSVTRQCWVAATADGQRTIYRIVEAGERLNVDAQRNIAVRFGDAGAVAWSINGRPGSTLGDAGSPRNLACRMPNAECQF